MCIKTDRIALMCLILWLFLTTSVFAQDPFTNNGSGTTSSGTISTGIVGPGNSGQVAYYPSTGTTVFGDPYLTISQGALTLGVSGVAGSLIINGATSGSVTLRTAAVAGSLTFQFPSTNGATGQFLQTDGTGITSWANPTGTGTVNSGTINQVAKYAATGTAVSGSVNMTEVSGTLTLGQSSSVAGSIVLNGSSSGAVTVSVPAAAGTTTFRLPGTNGTVGQFLQTDGSGVTSWQTVTSGSGSVNAGTINQITYYASSGSTVSGNANVTASSGAMTLGQAGTAGSVILNGSSSGTVTVNVPAAAGSTTFTLPSTNGSSGQFLQTNGSGVTSWQTAPGGGGGTGTVNSGTANQMTYYAGTGTVVSGNANATISAGAFTLGQSGTAGSVVLNGATSGTATIQVPAVAGSTTFQLPGTNGSSGQFLQTNGSGVTSWQTVSGSGTVNSGTSGQISWYSSTGTAVSGNANVTASSGSVTLGQAGSVAGALVLSGVSSGTGTIQVASSAGSTTFQLPSSNGSSGQFLQTNGSGVTSWQTVGTINSGTASQIAWFSSTGTTVSGNANATMANGALTLGQSATAGSVILNGATSGTATISVPAVAGSTTFQLPATNGSANQFLQTNGSGVTTWAVPTGSGTVNSGTANQLAYYATSTNAVSGNANVTVSSGAMTLGQAGTAAGSLILSGATSGTTTLKVAAVAGSAQYTLPTAAPSLAGAMMTSDTGGALSFSNTPPRFVSTANTITFASTTTKAHGLGVTPKKLWFTITNVTGEGGYTTGQEVTPCSVSFTATVGGNATLFGASMWADGTSVNCLIGASGILIPRVTATTGNALGITAANWTLNLYAEP